MALNRRTFLTRIAQGASAAVVLARVPVEWVPRVGRLREDVALNYLRKMYNAHVTWQRQHGASFEQAHPRLIVVDRDLWEAAAGELIANYRVIQMMPTPDVWGKDLAFKGARLRDGKGRGWKIHYMGPMDRAQYDS